MAVALSIRKFLVLGLGIGIPKNSMDNRFRIYYVLFDHSGRPAVPMPTLVVNPRTPQACEVQLKPGENFIGRGVANAVRLDDPSVSGTHCQITVTGDSVVVKELGSTNGTFINRTAVKEAILHPGQTLQLGAVEMDFAADGATALIGQMSGIPAPSSAPTSTAPPPALAVPRLPPPGVPKLPAPGAASRQAAPAKPAAGQKFLLGVAGGFAGGIAGMLIWFLVIKLTGYELGFIAWGVGALAGVGARVLGRAGSTGLGVAAALCAVIGIIGGQFLATKSELDKEMANAAASTYDERLAEAQKAAKLQTDQEIKVYLTSRDEEDNINADRIKSFRDNEQPKLKDLVSGKPTKEEFIKEQLRQRDRLESSMIINVVILFASFLHLFTLLWLFIGVSTSFRIASR
jgi:hypothetical protein